MSVGKFRPPTHLVAFFDTTDGGGVVVCSRNFAIDRFHVTQDCKKTIRRAMTNPVLGLGTMMFSYVGDSRNAFVLASFTKGLWVHPLKN